LKHVLLAIQMEQTAFSFKPTIFKINWGWTLENTAIYQTPSNSWE
jgi:hypothetical protein